MSKPLHNEHLFRYAAPQWHTEAKCARTDDPRIWDSDYYPKGVRTRANRATAALNACHGCPVLTECAQEALDQPMTVKGTVRAGVALSVTQAPGELLRWQRHALIAICKGTPPHLAIAGAIDTAGTTTRAQWAPVAAAARGWTPPPPRPRKAAIRPVRRVRGG